MEASISIKIHLLLLVWSLALGNIGCISSDLKLIKSSTIGFSYKASRSSGSDALHTFSIQSENLETSLVSDRFSNLAIRLYKFKPNEFVILSPPFQAPLQALKSPLPYVKTYLVFRPKEDTFVENEYSGHVAYVRKIDDDKSVEWGFIENVIPNGTFVSAFLIEPQSPNPDNRTFAKAFGHNRTYDNNVSTVVLGRSFGSASHTKQSNLVDDKDSESDERSRASNNHLLVKKAKGKEHKTKAKRSPKSEKSNKTKKSKAKKKVEEVLIFEGLGTCNKTKVEINATTFWQLDTRVSYYMNLFGLQCDPLFANDMKGMIEEGLVSEGVDFKYVMNMTHPYFTSEILDPKEWSSLISAVFLDVFSNAHADQTENVALKIHDNQSPSSQKISRTARTLTVFVFKMLYLMGSHFYYHTVKIANTVVEVLAVMIKTISSKDTPEVRMNDQLQLAGLIGFLQNDLLDTLTVGEYDIPLLFDEHFIKYFDTIKASLRQLSVNHS